MKCLWFKFGHNIFTGSKMARPSADEMKLKTTKFKILTFWGQSTSAVKISWRNSYQKLFIRVRPRHQTTNTSQGKIFPFLRPKTRGNEFQKLAIWGTIFVGAKRSVELKSSKSAKFWLSKSIFYVKNDTNLFKADLLQLNHTQFPSLRIFVGKKVGNRKN